MRKKKKKKKQILPKLKKSRFFGSKSKENPSYKAVRRSEDTHRTSSEPFSAKTGEKSPKNFLASPVKKQILPKLKKSRFFRSKSKDNPSHKTVRRSEDTHRTPWEPFSAKTDQLKQNCKKVMNVIKTKTVMVQGFTNKLKQYPSGNMRGTGCCVETSKNDYQSETKTVMVQGEYGEAQITKGKFWNVNGTMTNKLKQYPSWSFNHSSPNVYKRPGCCVDTSKNDYLGNVLIVQRPEDTHRDGPGHTVV